MSRKRPQRGDKPSVDHGEPVPDTDAGASAGISAPDTPDGNPPQAERPEFASPAELQEASKRVFSGAPDQSEDVPAAVSPDEHQDGDEEAETAPADPWAEFPPHPDEEITPARIVEALLFSSETPLSAQRLIALMGSGTAKEVRRHVAELNAGYERQRASFRIINVAGGYQMMTCPAFATWAGRLRESKQDNRLSPAALETLAVVAYKQPVVRAEIEALRGVSAGEMLNRLRELGLIKIVGRAEDVGRPMLYGTTRRFLEVFGLSGLEDLPAVGELQNSAGTS